MKLAFAGTPEMAVPALEALVDAGHHVDVVVTRPDKRRGRRGEPAPSPVKAAALAHGIEVVHDIDTVIGRDLDLGVVVAYGRIIRPHVLAALPMVNVHFSLLPRWRGAAPVERAILAGDEVTGVCVMEVAEGLDTGGVYASETVPIGAGTTADELRHELVEVGSRLLVDTLAAGLGEPSPQIGAATYADKIDPSERRVDWSAPAIEVDRRVRAGGAWTTFRGQRVKLLEGALVDGAWRPTVVQPAGKGAMAFEAWRNGVHPADDEWFE